MNLEAGTGALFQLISIPTDADGIRTEDAAAARQQKSHKNNGIANAHDFPLSELMPNGRATVVREAAQGLRAPSRARSEAPKRPRYWPEHRRADLVRRWPPSRELGNASLRRRGPDWPPAPMIDLRPRPSDRRRSRFAGCFVCWSPSSADLRSESG